MAEFWAARRFSLGNTRNEGADDLPKLLRRVADQIEELGIEPMDLLDLTVSSEITEDGPWWSVSLYWAPGEVETGDP